MVNELTVDLRDPKAVLDYLEAYDRFMGTFYDPDLESCLYEFYNEVLEQWAIMYYPTWQMEYPERANYVIHDDIEEAMRAWIGKQVK